MELFDKKIEKKHSVVALQLAPIIDVFIVIIIFLVMGALSKGVSVEVPPNLKLAKATTEDSLEITSEVHVLNEKQDIFFKFINEKISSVELLSDPLKQKKLQDQIKQYLDKLSPKNKSGGISLNLVIDEKIKYYTVFELSQFLRNSGFENLSFVTEREYSHAKK